MSDDFTQQTKIEIWMRYQQYNMVKYLERIKKYNMVRNIFSIMILYNELIILYSAQGAKVTE